MPKKQRRPAPVVSAAGPKSKNKSQNKPPARAARKAPAKAIAVRSMPAAKRRGPRSPEEEIRNATRAQRPLVTLRDADGDIAQLPVSANYDAVVNRWSFVLQSRRGWANREATRLAQAQNALDELQRLGLTEAQLQRAGNAGRLEVGIADADASSSEGDRYRLLYARRVPWEYLLSAATSVLGREQPLAITRHSGAVTGEGADAAPRAPQTLLYLQSAPGPLAKEFDFSSERRVITSALGLPEAHVVAAINTELAMIGNVLAGRHPDIVHVAGVDVHQARALLGPHADLDDARDGIVCRGERGALASVAAPAFASAIVDPARPPLLIGFNLHHSSAELAAEAVARGAGAAIGFQDEIDDQTAEYFFAALYREWRRADWNVFEAFAAAWRSLRGSITHLHGTGIVLWSGRSAFEARTPATAVAGAEAGTPRRGRTPVAPPPAPAAAPPRRAPAPAVVGADDVLVSVEIQREMNYALLHNELPIFRNLTLHKLVEGPPLPVDVIVELNVGSDSYPFRQTLKLGDEPVALADKVKVPLTSALARALRERVQSTLYVCVRARDTVVHQQTVRVTLLPVDEWLDDGKQSVWLPSFVLPRDPAVARVIDTAQRYLMALQDDPAAGFDGYQQVDPSEPSTTASVDMQVRALWCALTYDLGLAYINPPPSYSSRTQRLRTPSDVIQGRRGTCIDLALLLAACLEYVDIHPAIILLTGHAFPAYWRSTEAHENFVLANAAPQATAATTTSATTPGGSREGTVGRYGWQFKRQHFAQIMQSIQRGDLVPLETVGITSRSSFDLAMQDGLENLRSKTEFDSLLDLLQARRNEPPVTPLPIIQPEHGERS